MQTQVYHVKGLDCADCASVIKVDLEKMPEVKEVNLDFTRGTLRVSGEVTPEVISTHLHRLGFELAEAPQEPPETGLSFSGFWETLRNSQELRMTLPGLMLLTLLPPVPDEHAHEAIRWRPSSSAPLPSSTRPCGPLRGTPHSRRECLGSSNRDNPPATR